MASKVETPDDYEDLEPLFGVLATLDDQDPRRPRLRAELIRRCVPLAEHIARRYAGRGEPFDDIVQVACIGVVHAVDRFDPARGPRFLGFAIPTITGEIRRHFRDHTWTVRVPRSLKELHLRVAPTVQVLSQRLGRAPTAPEIAAEIDADPGDVSQAIAAGNAYQPISIDSPTYADDDAVLADSLSEADDDYDRIERCVAVAPLVAELGKRERRILRLRFFESMTQTQIAARLGISQMHVSRILTQTLATLRTRARAA